MTDAAFQATFSDFRLVKGRKVAQIVLEVAIEEADKALAVLGGVPQPATEAWVAVARLETRAKVVPIKPDNTKLSFEASQRCKNPMFWRFLNQDLVGGEPVSTESEAAKVVRGYCQIDSR